MSRVLVPLGIAMTGLAVASLLVGPAGVGVAIACGRSLSAMAARSPS